MTDVVMLGSFPKELSMLVHVPVLRPLRLHKETKRLHGMSSSVWRRRASRQQAQCIAQVVGVLVLLIPCTAAFSFGINGCETQLRSRGDASTPVHAQHIRMRSRGHGLLALRAGIELPPALMLAASVASAGKTFEAQAPPLGTTIAVLGSTAGVLAYWWLVLVPSERRDLAKNKNKGGLNDYLADLEKSGTSERKIEKWFYSEWLERRRRVQQLAAKNAAKRAAANAAKADGTASESYAPATAVGVLEKTGAADEITEAAVEKEVSDAREREIEKAIPMPSFLSLDNPVIIAISLALLGAAFGSGR